MVLCIGSKFTFPKSPPLPIVQPSISHSKLEESDAFLNQELFQDFQDFSRFQAHNTEYPLEEAQRRTGAEGGRWCPVDWLGKLRVSRSPFPAEMTRLAGAFLPPRPPLTPAGCTELQVSEEASQAVSGVWAEP